MHVELEFHHAEEQPTLTLRRWQQPDESEKSMSSAARAITTRGCAVREKGKKGKRERERERKKKKTKQNANKKKEQATMKEKKRREIPLAEEVLYNNMPPLISM